MADVCAGIHARLAAYADLTDLVSSRIWRVRAQHEETYPFVVIHKISDQPWHAMGGDINPLTARIQITCRDDDGAGLDAVAVQIRAALSRWSGTAGTVVFQEIFFDDENETYEADLNSFQKTLDFIAHYDD
jgi:hypothetical protein